MVACEDLRAAYRGKCQRQSDYPVARTLYESELRIRAARRGGPRSRGADRRIFATSDG